MRRGMLALAVVIGAVAPSVVLGACGTTKTTAPADATSAPSPPPGETTVPASTGTAQGGRTAAECPSVALSSVELPPTDGGLMNNAQPDASFDRNSNEFTALIHKSRDRFRCCYDVMIQSPGKGDSKGSFVIDFTLKPDGTFKSSEHNKALSDIKDDAMGECSLNVLRAIQFPVSKKGKETTVSYPFRFTPRGSGK